MDFDAAFAGEAEGFAVGGAGDGVTFFIDNAVEGSVVVAVVVNGVDAEAFEGDVQGAAVGVAAEGEGAGEAVGGLIGDVEYEGRAIDDFMPLICAGEILGVGTGTSIGLGRYQIVS